MELDAVADELYGLSLDDFIPTRNAREKQAKGANDKALAAEIHRLPKPNAVGWLINQLVRQHIDEIQTLLELGSAMREATANLSGDRLRELSRQQHDVLRDLVQQAERLANAAGRQVSADTARSLEETFNATLADPGAADAVAAGQLTAGLQSTGFLTAETSTRQRSTSASKPPRVKGVPPAKEGREIERGERAEAKVAQAKSVAEAAAQVRNEAQTTMEQAEQSVADASNLVEQLRKDLHESLEAQSKAQRDRRRAQAAFDRADHQLVDANRRWNEAASE